MENEELRTITICPFTQGQCRRDCESDDACKTAAEDDAKWDNLFAYSPNVLEELALEALAEHKAGRTKKIG